MKHSNSDENIRSGLTKSRTPAVDLSSSSEAAGEKGLYDTLIESCELNPNYEYDDNDINLCFRAICKKNGWMVRDGCDFIINGPNNGLFRAEDDGRDYLVACTPTVDTLGLMRPIDYYLDMAQQPGNVVVDLLQNVVNNQSLDLSVLSSKNDAEIADLIKAVTGQENADVIARVLNILRLCKFDRNSVLVDISDRLKSDPRKDVFHEIMPLVMIEPRANVKIIMSYNITNVHWLLCEICIFKDESSYSVYSNVHDPKSVHKMSTNNLEKLNKAVTKRIKNFDANANIRFIAPPGIQVFTIPRQPHSDNTSCGPIMLMDMESRIRGQGLKSKSYPVGAVDLRRSMIRYVEDHFGVNNAEVVIKFIDRNIKSKEARAALSLAGMLKLCQLDFSDSLFTTVEGQKESSKKDQLTGLSSMSSFRQNPTLSSPYQSPIPIFRRRSSQAKLATGRNSLPHATPSELMRFDPNRTNWSNITSGEALARLLNDRNALKVHRQKALALGDIIVRNATDLHTRQSDSVHFAMLAASNELKGKVLNQFTTQLAVDRLDPSVEIDLITGLSRTLEVALTHQLDHDGLINIYRTQFEILSDLHAKNPDATNMLTVLKGICQVTDAMVDAQVVEISKEEIQKPAYTVLGKLKAHPNAEVQFLANYAIQGILRIKKSEPAYKYVLKKVGYVLNIVGEAGTIAARIAAAVLGGGASIPWCATIPKNLISIYENGVKLFETQIKPAEWYDQLRLFELCYRVVIDNRADQFPFEKVESSEIKHLPGDLEFYRGYVYLLEKIYEEDGNEKSIMRSDEVMRKLRSLFNHLLKNVNDAWTIGRLTRLINLTVTDRTVLSNQEVLAFLPKLQGGFDRLNKEERTLVEFQKFIRYGLVIVLLNCDNDVVNNTLNLLANIYKDLGNQYLDQHLVCEKWWKSFDKDVKAIRSEVINAFRLLLMYGSMEVRQQVILKIDDINEYLQKSIGIQTYSQKQMYVKARELLKSLQLDTPDRIPSLNLPKLTVEMSDEFILLKEAKQELATNTLDFSLLCDGLLGDYSSLGRTDLLTDPGGEFNELDLYTSMNVKIYGSLDKIGKDITEIIENYLLAGFEEATLLLLGNTGSGKTMFCHYYARVLATKFEKNEYNKKELLPIFISLPHFFGYKFKEGDKAEHIEIYIKDKYKINDCSKLETDYQVVFFLDSYDEANMTIYLRNYFKKWRKAKLIVTCRTQWILDSGEGYQEYFSRTDSSERVVSYEVMPFQKQQYEFYIVKYLLVMKVYIQNAYDTEEDKNKWTNPATYLDYIRGDQKIPGLDDLIQTPFLLRISMDNMEELAETYQKSREEVTLLDLYNKFVDKFFKRQISKLSSRKELQEIMHKPWIILMEQFCENMADDMDKELRQKGKPWIIVYDRDTNLPPWNKYWQHPTQSTEKERLLCDALLTAVPLRKAEFTSEAEVVKEYAYQFLHDTLLSYFLFKKGLAPMARFDERALAKRAARLDGMNKPVEEVDEAKKEDEIKEVDSDDDSYEPSDFLGTLGK